MNEGVERNRNKLCLDRYGMTPKQAQAKGVCIRCQAPVFAYQFETKETRQVYRVSGLCATCQKLERDEQAPGPTWFED